MIITTMGILVVFYNILKAQKQAMSRFPKALPLRSGLGKILTLYGWTSRQHKSGMRMLRESMSEAMRLDVPRSQVHAILRDLVQACESKRKYRALAESLRGIFVELGRLRFDQFKEFRARQARLLILLA